MSTKDTFRERRRSVAVRRARTSDKIDAFPFCRDERDQKRERNTRDGASSYTLKFLVRFCFPAEILFADRNSYARKKERKNDEVYSSLLLSSIINSSSLYIVLMNYVKSVVSASVSLGQFYRYLVRIHHGTPRRRERRVQIPFHDDEEEVKEKREERSKTSASLNALKKGAHINVPSVSAARTNKSSFVVFEGEKGSALMVRRWFKTRSRS